MRPEAGGHPFRSGGHGDDCCASVSSLLIDDGMDGWMDGVANTHGHTHTPTSEVPSADGKREKGNELQHNEDEGEKEITSDAKRKMNEEERWRKIVREDLNFTPCCFAHVRTRHEDPKMFDFTICRKRKKK